MRIYIIYSSKIFFRDLIREKERERGKFIIVTSISRSGIRWNTIRRGGGRRREENSVGRSTCARGGTSVSSELPDVFSTLAVAFRFIRALCAFDLAIARHVLRLLRPPPSSPPSPRPVLLALPRFSYLFPEISSLRSLHVDAPCAQQQENKGYATWKTWLCLFFFFFSFFIFFFSLSLSHTYADTHFPSSSNKSREGLSRAMLFPFRSESGKINYYYA